MDPLDDPKANDTPRQWYSVPETIHTPPGLHCRSSMDCEVIETFPEPGHTAAETKHMSSPLSRSSYFSSANDDVKDKPLSLDKNSQPLNLLVRRFRRNRLLKDGPNKTTNNTPTTATLTVDISASQTRNNALKNNIVVNSSRPQQNEAGEQWELSFPDRTKERISHSSSLLRSSVASEMSRTSSIFSASVKSRSSVATSLTSWGESSRHDVTTPTMPFAQQLSEINRWKETVKTETSKDSRPSTPSNAAKFKMVETHSYSSGDSENRKKDIEYLWKSYEIRQSLPDLRTTKKYFCTHCTRGFARANDWRVHEERYHEQYVKYPCPDCDIILYSTCSFNCHHQAAHSCQRCEQGADCIKQVERSSQRTAWGCGFCGELFLNWRLRCRHVIYHYNQGVRRIEWKQSKLIIGLLKQDDIDEQWRALLIEKHGEVPDPPISLRWSKKATGRGHAGTQQLQDLLEIRTNPIDPRRIAELAYALGIRTSHPEFKEEPGSPTKVELHYQTDDTRSIATPTTIATISNPPVPYANDTTLHSQTSNKEQQIAKIIYPGSCGPRPPFIGSSKPMIPFRRAPNTTKSFEKIITVQQPTSANSIPSNSSTDYAEADFDTDDDTDEDTEDVIDSLVSHYAIYLSNMIIANMENVLPSAVVRCTGNDQTHGSAPAENSLSSLIGMVLSERDKRSRENEDHQDPNDPSQPPNKRRRDANECSVTTNNKALRLACPFFKNNPQEYRNHRSCPGPGWQNVARVKEHLFRRHTQPIHCPKCFVQFKEASALAAHLREETCSVLEGEPPEGLTAEQQERLRSRRRDGRSDEEKWRDMYCIIFPGTAEWDIPSPYYDGQNITNDELVLRRELTRLIRRDLMALLDQNPGPVRGLLMAEVPGIVERNIARLFRDGTQDEEPTGVDDSHPSTHSDGSGDSPNQPEPNHEPRTVQPPVIASSHLNHVVEAGPSQPWLELWDSEPTTVVSPEQHNLTHAEITSENSTVQNLDPYLWPDSTTTNDEIGYDYIGLQNIWPASDQIYQELIMEPDNGASNRSSAVEVAS